MYNKVRAVLDGRDEVVVDPISMDFVDYQQLIGDRKISNIEFLLFVAYRECEGPPKTLRAVHDWGRANRVIVEEVPDTASDPTLPDQSPG
jgi:hypothetical protein